MTADFADVIAARKLLGEDPDGETHPQVFGLIGADHCPHVICGNGEEVERVHGWRGHPLSQWRLTPYRHHVYTENEQLRAERGFSQCICGNGTANPVHQLCEPAREEWR